MVANLLIKPIPKAELDVEGQVCAAVVCFPEGPVGDEIIEEGGVGNVDADALVGHSGDEARVALGKKAEANAEVGDGAVVVEARHDARSGAPRDEGGVGRDVGDDSEEGGRRVREG